MLHIELEVHTVKPKFQGAIGSMLNAHGIQIVNVKNHLGPVTAKDGTIILAYMDGLELRRQGLLTEASNPERVAAHAALRKTLVDQMLVDKECVFDLFYFIEKAFEEDQWHDQKVLAGYAYYAEAGDSYEKNGQMLVASINYWNSTGISALLISKGATAATGTKLTDGQTDLATKGGAFIVSMTAEHELANTRMKALNLFHQDCMVVDKASKRAFKADKEIRDGQTYTVILQGLHPEHQVLQHFIVRRVSQKHIKNAVVYKMVKCLKGIFDLYDGTLPIIPENKLATLHQGEEIENIWGADLVFVNTLTSGEALGETTRMVHES